MVYYISESLNIPTAEKVASLKPSFPKRKQDSDLDIVHLKQAQTWCRHITLINSTGFLWLAKHKTTPSELEIKLVHAKSDKWIKDNGATYDYESSLECALRHLQLMPQTAFWRQEVQIIKDVPDIVDVVQKWR